MEILKNKTYVKFDSEEREVLEAAEDILNRLVINMKFEEADRIYSADNDDVEFGREDISDIRYVLGELLTNTLYIK